MQNGTGNSLRLLMAAILTFGGLAAIIIGIVIAITPANDPACAAGARCITSTAVPPVADRLRHSDTD